MRASEREREKERDRESDRESERERERERERLWERCTHAKIVPFLESLDTSSYIKEEEDKKEEPIDQRTILEDTKRTDGRAKGRSGKFVASFLAKRRIKDCFMRVKILTHANIFYFKHIF